MSVSLKVVCFRIIVMVGSFRVDWEGCFDEHGFLGTMRM